MGNKLRIKRDVNTTNPPGADQLEVGELAFNALTGKLYSKLSSGIVIEFVGRPICFNKSPTIIMPDVSSFCCYGDILNITVKDLYPEKYTNNNYTFLLEDITRAGEIAQIIPNDPILTDYQVTPDLSIIDTSQNVIATTMKQAVVPYNIIIKKPIAILKFSIHLLENTQTSIVAESKISITCNKF